MPRWKIGSPLIAVDTERVTNIKHCGWIQFWRNNPKITCLLLIILGTNLLFVCAALNIALTRIYFTGSKFVSGSYQISTHNFEKQQSINRNQWLLIWKCCLRRMGSPIKQKLIKKNIIVTQSMYLILILFSHFPRLCLFVSWLLW